MRICRGIIPLSILVMLAATSQAQTNEINYYDSISNYNIAIILFADSFIAEDREGNAEIVKKREPLGFIGDNFQRFSIHFSSVIKNADNPYQYIVQGKTKFNGAVHDFTGTLIVKEAKVYDGEIPGYKQGYALSELNLSDASFSSISIKGKLVSHFLIDNKQQFRYDGSDLSAGNFCNNQFTGIWRDDKITQTKICHWGDYRIPSSGDLDIGAGEFSPSEKYFATGWQQYHDAYIKNDKAAIQKEQLNWWECDSVIGASVNTDTTLLKNQAKLYYQFNCDSIWLTLQQKTGKTAIIFSMGSELHGYLYRLGFQLMKEESQTLIFRTGCAANGPCHYVWINKSTGKVLRSK